MAEAMAIVLDIGPHMDQAPPGCESYLETSLNCIQMILQRKMFAESKDEVAVVLFGSDHTANQMAAEHGGYEYINVAQPMAMVNWPMLQFVQNDVESTDKTADFMDALVIASDHLMRSTTAMKKKFETKSIVLFSNLAAPFGDEEAEDIINGLKNSEIDLKVIGPNLDSSDSQSRTDDDDSEHHVPRPPQKPKTAQQRAGELMIKQVLDSLGGDCYSFDEAIELLSFFQKKAVKQIQYKYHLETGSMQVPVRMCTRVSEAKTKPLKKVYAKDPTALIETKRTYHLNDENETEVEKDELINAHRYGNSLIPFSEEDTANMKLEAEKCLKVLGFTNIKNIKRHHFMGSSVICVVSEPGDDVSSVTLSALVHAMYESNHVAVVRRVYQNRAAPKLGLLTPQIKVGYECLLYTEVPFAEDVRQYTFSSLPLNDEAPEAVLKMKPNEDQLTAMDDLINEMDLCPKDEDGEVEELLKPKMTFNPYRQRLFQCILHRGLKPNDPLPDLNPVVGDYLKVPDDICVRSETVLERMKGLFRLVRVPDGKKKENGEGEEPPKKKAKLDSDHTPDDKPKATEITSVTPVEDFKSMIQNDDRFQDACKQLSEKTTEIIRISFNKSYPKAIGCIKVLREECLRRSRPEIYNEYMQKLKEFVVEKKLSTFWQSLVAADLSLIHRTECSASGVSMAAAQAFLDEETDTQDDNNDMDGFWDDGDDDFMAKL